MDKKYVCNSKCALPKTADLGKIVVHEAKEHNLKNICFAIPKGKLVALTGPSGSGKSSIAVEVLQKECLRQFLESLGMTTDHLAKAKVGHIMGLSPSIGVTQRVADFNPRSTVGTKTGILTILRNLFAAIGHRPCESCGKIIMQPLQDKSHLTMFEYEEFSKKRKKSYFQCPNCGHQLEKLKMAHFSFNALAGACTVCKGVGEVIEVDIPKVLNEEKSLKEGGVSFWDEGMSSYYENVLQKASHHYDFPFDTTVPIKNYTEEQRNFLLYGVDFPEFVKTRKNVKKPKKVSEGRFEGLVSYLLKSRTLPEGMKKYVRHKPCTACQRTRLGKIGREVTVHGKTLVNLTGLSLTDLLAWIQALEKEISQDESEVFEALACAMKQRVENLIEVGLGYLTLDRSLPSLSVGESQRLRLACVLGSGLTGILYVLDEPTTGLHPHDTRKLVKTLRRIQEAGNTVLIIEHDLEMIKEVDYILDIGPGGGSKGGEIVVCGTPNEVRSCPTSLTGKYLAKKIIGEPNRLRPHDGRVVTVRGASAYNLKGIDVTIPVNQFIVLTGVSGSGKSTFLFGILDKVARQHFYGASELPGKHVSIEGLEHFHRVVTVDPVTVRKTQSSRSNVATYTKLFDSVRELFASLPEAKASGFGPDQFSFNTSDQRCENCGGAGVVAIDMTFMPDVEVECPICEGRRFTEELLSIQFQGHHIAAILEMTVGEALSVFRDHQNIFPLLDLLEQVGLEYLVLGQSTSTLSGGEAQRMKLATELAKSGRKSTLYLLDEPTTGLHPHEVDKLLRILSRLVDKGNTVIVIEHHLDAICQADTIIDFGPGGGDAGGQVIAIGSPQEIAANRDSLTGKCLKNYTQVTFEVDE